MKMEGGSDQRWLWGGFLVALVVVVLVVLAVTRTDPGREQALEWTLGAIGGRLSGELDVGRISGDLLTGAKLYDVSLRGFDGHPLLLADSAFIEYKLPTFLGGDVIIRDLVVYNGQLSLRRLPGDSLWNYQEILTDPTPSPDTTLTATVIEGLRLVDVGVTVHLPWEPEEQLAPSERERAIEEALANTSRLMVEAVDGGFLREIRFSVFDASVAELILAPDERGGTFLEVLEADASGWLWRGDPLRVVDAAGEIGLSEGVLRFDLPRAELPESSARVFGTVDMSAEEARFDITVEASSFALSDLQWLYPQLPDEGTGQVRLIWETRPEGTLYLARDLLLESPDTRIVGDIGLILNGEISIVEARLRASPLTSEFLDQLLPSGLPVEGLRIEELEVTG